jgi:hypothetical protein
METERMARVELIVGRSESSASGGGLVARLVRLCTCCILSTSVVYPTMEDIYYQYFVKWCTVRVKSTSRRFNNSGCELSETLTLGRTMVSHVTILPALATLANKGSRCLSARFLFFVFWSLSCQRRKKFAWWKQS